MPSRSLPRSLVLVVAGSLVSSGAAFARPVFVGHRAVYEMRLADRAETSEIGAASGRLVYEFSGSSCEGWATRLRMVTRLDPVEGTSRLTDLRTTTFEDDAGRSFDFLNENWVDGQRLEQTKGHASREGDGVRVAVEKPAAASATLPASVLFPTAHMKAIVEAAEQGRELTEIELFDGSETGVRPYHTTVVIGREATGPDDTADEPAAAVDLLKDHRRWPIQISFYDLAKKEAGDATPDYQLSFLLYDNGVSRHMRFDYGSFVLRGDLSSLEPISSEPCR